MAWAPAQRKETKKKKKHLKKCVRTRTPVRKPLCARRRRAINIRHSGIRWWQSSSAGKLQVRCLKQVDGKSQLCHWHSWLAPPCLALLRHCIKNSLLWLFILRSFYSLQPKTPPEQALNEKGWINRRCCQCPWKYVSRLTAVFSCTPPPPIPPTTSSRKDVEGLLALAFKLEPICDDFVKRV